jgi:hypothetical protein
MEMALKPLGFQRRGSLWVRVRGDMEETVEIERLQPSGCTVQVGARDIETDKLYCEIFGLNSNGYGLGPVTLRIGELIDGYGREWGSEPEGPEDMADKVLRFGIPWFDKVRTLKDQAENWYGRHSKVTRGYFGPSMIRLALTLYRMGERDEACQVLRKPVPKTAIPTWIDKVARVRAWMGCDSTASQT